MNNYYKQIVSSYEKNKQKINTPYISNELEETELTQYIDAAKINIKNNEKKVRCYRLLLYFLILITIFLILALLCNLPLDKNKETLRILIAKL
jgi:t-SNARE complex subunit (syntaxin)